MSPIVARRLWQLLVILALIVSVICFFTSITLEAHYARVGPIKPDIVTDHTVPLLYHGKTVYVTAGEDIMRRGLFIGSVVAFFAGVAVERIARPFRKRRPK